MEDLTSLKSSWSAISFKEDLNSLESFFNDLVKEDNCLINLGRSFGPTTTITTIKTRRISPQPKVNRITFHYQNYSLYFYLLFYHHRSYLF